MRSLNAGGNGGGAVVMEEATRDDGIVAGDGCTAVREATCNGEGGAIAGAGGGAEGTGGEAESAS